MSGKESPHILKNGRYRHGGNATGTHKERAPHRFILHFLSHNIPGYQDG